VLDFAKSIFWTVFGLKTWFLVKNWAIGYLASYFAVVMLQGSIADPSYEGHFPKEFMNYGLWFFPLAGVLYPYAKYRLENSEAVNPNMTLVATIGIAMLIMALTWIIRNSIIFMLAPMFGLFGLASLWKNYQLHNKP